MEPREFQFVFAGFCAAWIIVMCYALTLGLRERRLRKELDRVRKMVEKR
jgi:CcmD family protein